MLNTRLGDEQQCYDQRREEEDKKPGMDVISHKSLSKSLRNILIVTNLGSPWAYIAATT